MQNIIGRGAPPSSISAKTESAALVAPLAKAEERQGEPTASTVMASPPDPLDLLSGALNQIVHSTLAHLTAGLSPAAVAEAYFDWAVHLAFSPGKQAQLVGKATRKWIRLAANVQNSMLSGGRGKPCIEPLPQDRRFAAKEWQGWPRCEKSQGRKMVSA